MAEVLLAALLRGGVTMTRSGPAAPPPLLPRPGRAGPWSLRGGNGGRRPASRRAPRPGPRRPDAGGRRDRESPPQVGGAPSRRRRCGVWSPCSAVPVDWSPDPLPVRHREAGKGRQVVAGVAEHGLDLEELAAERTGDDVELGVHLLGLGLGEDGADRQRPGVTWFRPLGRVVAVLVAVAVDPWLITSVRCCLGESRTCSSEGCCGRQRTSPNGITTAWQCRGQGSSPLSSTRGAPALGGGARTVR